MANKDDTYTHSNRVAAHLAVVASTQSDTPCVDDNDLAAYIDRALSATDIDRVENHLAHCAACFTRWHDVSDVLATTQSNRVEQVINLTDWARRRKQMAKSSAAKSFLPVASVDALKAAASTAQATTETRVEEYPVYIGSGDSKVRMGSFSIKPVLGSPSSGLLVLKFDNEKSLPDFNGCTLRVRAGNSDKILLTDTVFNGELRALVEHVDDFRISITLEIES